MKKKKGDRPKPRGRASKSPPYISLGEVVELARVVSEQDDGRMLISEFARAVKRAHTSSGFRRRVAAIRAFGLIKTIVNKTTGERRVQTTDLAKKILEPHSPKKEQEGKYEALINIPEFKKLLETYEDVVPGEEYIANVLADEFQIPDDLRNPWVKCFMTSCYYAEIIYEVRGKQYFSKPALKVEATARISYESLQGVSSEAPVPYESLQGMSTAAAEPNVFEFPPTTLVGGTVSNISFVNMDKITPDGIDQFIKVSQGIASFLKARIPTQGPSQEEKKESRSEKAQPDQG